MTRTVHFADSFWGDDFCSTAGFEAVVRRMKDGNTTCSRVAAFIKQRASIESEYAAKLQKIAKTTDFTSEESGFLRSSLDAARLSLERIAESHITCSKQLAECSEKVLNFSDKQKTDRQQEEEVMKKSIMKKHSLYKKTLDAKKFYHQKAREAEMKEDVMARAKCNKATIPTKEWDNLFKANEKAKQDCIKADQQYKELIRQLDEARDQWQRDMTRFCEYCEKQDYNRLKTLQNELWTQCNVISQTCVEEDDQCEVVRLALEKMIFEADISSFVEVRQTGQSKPVAIVYEPYTSITTQNWSDSSHTFSSSSSTSTKPQRPIISSSSTVPSQPTQPSSKSSRPQGIISGSRSNAPDPPSSPGGAGRAPGPVSRDNNNTTKPNTSATVRSLPVVPTSRANQDEVSQTLPRATPRQNVPPSPGPGASGGDGVSVVEAPLGAKPGKFEFTVKSPPLRLPGTNSKASTLSQSSNEKTSSRL